jgi:hypothetical protein
MVLEVEKLTDDEISIIDLGLSMVECNFKHSEKLQLVKMIRALIELEAIKRGFY